MSKRYLGGFITKNPATPTGPFAEGSAPGVWTLDQAMQYTKQGIWPQANNPTPNDPQFQYVTSLLHADGTNGGQNNTFLDSSTNNFTITRNGNTTQGSFSPYGPNWGNYFGGSTSALSIGSATGLNFGTGDFTLETWFCLTATSNTDQGIMSDNGGSFASGSVIFKARQNFYSGTITVQSYDFNSGGATLLQSTTVPQVGVWYHVAIVRSGNTFSLYVNGLRESTNTFSGSINFNNNNGTNIGRSVLDGSNGYLTGYLSNLRAVKGTAVYTSNFTPSTTPLIAITNTSLLTCQANRFIDASTNAYSITVAGTPQVTRFSPFAPTYSTQYSTSVDGGSGYFDGSGDNLTLASTSIDNFGTGDFTVEAWIYVTTASTNNPVVVDQTNGQFAFGIAPSNYLYYGTSDVADILASSTISGLLNTWNHIAISRTSGTSSLYLNGARVATGADSTNWSSGGLWIGRRSSGASFNGYISDVRVIKGTGIYSGTTITVPASPLTAVSNTQLLCNFTNAAIFDNSEMADYETVGNAQISTSVKKFGTGSLAFDGSGDYLVTRNPDSEFAFGSGNFTIEFWFYSNSFASSSNIFDFRPDGNDGSSTPFPTAYTNTSGQLVYFVLNGDRITSSALSTGTWYHVAISRAGTSTKMFINGTQNGSTYSDSNNYSCGANRPTIGINGYNTGILPFNGYLDDFRITKGYARYWENFTPPTAAFPNFGGAPQIPAQDPQFNYTTLLLPGNGTNGAQNNTFLDSSTNNFTITRNGNTTQGTFTPYGSNWSNYFDGDGDYLTAPSNAAFDLGSGNFTIEMWINPTALPSGREPRLLQIGGDSNDYLLLDYNINSNQIKFGMGTGGGPTNIITYSGLPALGQWTHIAVVRSGTSTNQVKLYINGSNVASGTYAGTMASGGTVWISGIGWASTTTYNHTGYISNLRIVKGTAIYTSNFTPSTTQLTAVSGTSLLTCQSNRFIDNSSNAFAITRNGTPSVQEFSPFAPTAPYSVATNGGSGYFDGTGDYLTVPYNSALDVSTGDFTVECWYYVTGSSGGFDLFTLCSTGDSYGTVRMQASSGVGIYYLIGQSGGWGIAYSPGSSFFNPNAWNHAAVTRSGDTFRFYLNGVLLNSQSLSGALTASATTSYVGVNNTSTLQNFMLGYISGLRVVKGTALYTGSTYTIPTAPLTAVSGTSLLLNYTNAGIPDATMMNDLETVGNAQISTAQSKFGTGSLYFDGQNTGGFDSVIYAPNNPAYKVEGDFTIEGWNYPLAQVRLYPAVIDIGGFFNAASGAIVLYFNHSDNPNKYLLYVNTTQVIAGTIAPGDNAWHHFALTRYGNTFRLFVNGVLDATGTYSTTPIFTANPPVFIGSETKTRTITVYTGYLQDIRLTNGYARYVQNFTPPTQAFQLY